MNSWNFSIIALECIQLLSLQSDSHGVSQSPWFLAIWQLFLGAFQVAPKVQQTSHLMHWVRRILFQSCRRREISAVLSISGAKFISNGYWQHFLHFFHLTTPSHGEFCSSAPYDYINSSIEIHLRESLLIVFLPFATLRILRAINTILQLIQPPSQHHNQIVFIHRIILIARF